MSDQWGPPGGPASEPGPPNAWAPAPSTPPRYSPPPGQPVYGSPPQAPPPGGGWEPPPAVYPQVGYPQHHGVPPAGEQTPAGLKVLVIVLSVLKAIPMVLMLLLLFLFGSLSNSFDDIDGFEEVDNALGGVFAVFAVVVLIIVAIGATLLFFHIRSAVKHNLTALAVVAGILTAIDLLWFIATASGDPVQIGSILLMGAILAGQGAVLAWALSARSS